MMASYQYYPNTPAAMSAAHSHGHHGNGRRRGPPRLSMSQNPKQARNNVRVAAREMAENAAVAAYREHFEQWTSFDLEDDLEFCPNLITESDMMSLSSSSERSSLASNSPNSSPTQQPQTVASGFSLSSSASSFSSNGSFSHPSFQSQHSLTMHQPSATRARNAIPIINPATGITMASPSPSISPSRMPQTIGRRW